MQPIEFDPVKSQLNFEQHGFHLSHCNFIDWNLMWAIPDIRKPYGEMRWIAFAPIGNRFFVWCSPYATARSGSSV
jgi:hypothetical protein